MFRRLLLRSVAAALFGAALVGFVASPTTEAQPQRQTGTRIGLNYPGRNDAGNWDGTWYYANRNERWVMWMRTRPDGLPELKLRYQNVDKAESFTTDWTPTVEYVHRGTMGRFRIDLEERDANLIRGNWSWSLGVEGRSEMFRTEQAKFVMYRGGDGRSLVVKYEDFERVYKTKDNELRLDPPVTITFMKASRRQADWNELPF